MKRKQRKSFPRRRFGYLILTIIKFFFEFLFELSMLWEAISNTRKSVYHQISKHKLVLGSNLHRGQITKLTFQAIALRQPRRRAKAPNAIFVTSFRWKFEPYQLVWYLVSMFYSSLLHGMTKMSLQNKPFICVTVSVCLRVCLSVCV